MPLDKQIATVLQQFREMPEPDFSQIDAAQYRQFSDNLLPPIPGDPMSEVRELRVAGANGEAERVEAAELARERRVDGVLGEPELLAQPDEVVEVDVADQRALIGKVVRRSLVALILIEAIAAGPGVAEEAAAKARDIAKRYGGGRPGADGVEMRMALHKSAKILDGYGDGGDWIRAKGGLKWRIRSKGIRDRRTVRRASGTLQVSR